MHDVTEWLQFDACQVPDLPELLTGLCGRLTAAGIPLDFTVLEIQTLHPLMASARYEWRQGSPQALEAPHFHDPFGQGSMLDTMMVRSLDTQTSSTDPAGRGHTERLPLAVTFSDKSCHKLIFAADRPDGFTPEEADLLHRIARIAAAPIEIIALRQMTTTLMTTYLGRRTAKRVLSGAIRRGDGDSVDAVLWYSDLRGFTAASESLARDAVIALLNSHFERLVAPNKAFGGEVLKFIGDGLLAIFPIEAAGSTERAAGQAIKAVRSARAGMASLNGERQARGDGVLEFGVALHLGQVMYGNIGAPDRLDFTVIGPTVNLASRLEALCKPLNCPVLVSAAFKEGCDQQLVPLGTHRLPDIAAPIAAYTLGEFADNKSGGGLTPAP